MKYDQERWNNLWWRFMISPGSMESDRTYLEWNLTNWCIIIPDMLFYGVFS